MVKKGDTLIEVVLAVGIFSMIAIAVVAVMNGGMSGAQTALETTLARAEIDSQAEALRFIHNSYTTEKGSANQKYQTLWKEITDSAINLGDLSKSSQNAILQYNPTSCSELYSENGEVQKNAFVINYRQLGNFTADSRKEDAKSWPLVKASAKKDAFAPASTYPHLIYKNGDTIEDKGGLAENSASFNEFYRAEGIYVIAIKDDKTTNINDKKTSAFYDFYIRTCWYGSNADEPSTISTIIRLYDPSAVE